MLLYEEDSIMFCGNCGTENQDGARFCKNCGTSLAAFTPGEQAQMQQNTIQEAPAQSKPTPVQVQSTTTPASEPPKTSKPVPKGLIVGAAAVLLVAVLAVIFIMSARSRINLDKYVIVKTDGYDGYGTASVRVDWDAIEEKYGDKLTIKKKAANKEYGYLLNDMTATDILSDCIDVEVSADSNLSNGSEVTYTWDIDDDVYDMVKCKLKYKNGSVKVSDLTKVETFDAFKDLEVEFYNVAPDGRVNLNYTGNDMDYYDFYCDQTSGLKNGDTIKVTIDEGVVSRYAEQYGKIPEEMEKEYTVEGLSSYVTKRSDINDAGLSVLQRQAEDVFNAYVAKDWEKEAHFNSMTYVGDYLLTSKESDPDSAQYTSIYLVYKINGKISKSDDDVNINLPINGYWYIMFSDMKVDGDGNLDVDITNYSTPGDNFNVNQDGWYWYIRGYETLDELYKNVVAARMDSYNHEDNIDESAAKPEKAEEAAPEAGEASNGGDYILPDSDTRLITKDDLEGFSKQDCKLARNEIYARHGRKFKDKELQAYFDSKDWYNGTIEPGDFKDSDLSSIESKNKDTIVEFEKEKGYR